MNEKRTQQLNIRITQELESILTEEGKKLKWTKTKLAETILTEWANNRDKNGGAMQFIFNHIQTININP